MKNILIICLLVLPAVVSAQSLSRSRRELRRDLCRGSVDRQQPQLLEPLLPFAEAVEKAKANDPQGWYALAIYYAKGEEIQWDKNNARQCLQKAYDMNYSNAVFVATLLDAYELQESGSHNQIRSYQPILSSYTGFGFSFVFSTNSLSIANAADIAKIRAGYERAFKLGVSAATNELARFEQRINEYKTKLRDDAEKLAMQKRNSDLAVSLLGLSVTPKKQESIEALRKRLNDPDADYDNGRTFLWEAGGKDGLSLDVLIRVRFNGCWHYIEKATITIDKDGKIIKVQGKPGVTRIRS